MPYLQPGRSIWTVRMPSLTRKGTERVSSGTEDERTASDLELMGRILKQRGDTDLLQAGLEGRTTWLNLYHAWKYGDVDAFRATLRGVDLDPLVDLWLTGLEKVQRRKPKTLAMYRLQVRSLIPAGRSFPSTALTSENVERWLLGLDVESTSTRRRYWSALSCFVSWLRSRKYIPSNPLEELDAPSNARPRSMFLTPEEVLRVAAWKGMPEKYRDPIVFCYATGIDGETFEKIRRRDVDLSTMEVRAPGEKAFARDRVIRCASFGEEVLRQACRAKLPDAPLFEGVSIDQLSRWHGLAAAAVGFKGLWLHDCRRSWAVRLLKVGVSPEQVARGLGHGDATMVIKVYGRWAGSRDEREAAEQKAAEADRARQMA